MTIQESGSAELAALTSIEAFPLLSETDEVLELARTNLGEDERLTFEDLDVLHAPGGAATQWALPTAEGERQVEHIVGVIILHKKANTYWAKPYEETGGGTSPDCYSVDGKAGIGDPGGACAVCPMNRFTGDPPRKPCREVKNLLIAAHDRLMPLVIRVSPGSLKPVGTYFRRLINDRRRHHEVVTRFSLNVARNESDRRPSIPPPWRRRDRGARRLGW